MALISPDINSIAKKMDMRGMSRLNRYLHNDKGLLEEFVSLTFFKSHLTNLLRYETHHKYQDGCRKQKRTHIGKATPREECIEVIT